MHLQGEAAPKLMAIDHGLIVQRVRPLAGLSNGSEAAQPFVALYLKRRGWLGGIIKLQRNDVAQPLMWALRVVMVLNGI